MTALKLATIVAVEVFAAVLLIVPRSATSQANPPPPLVPMARYCVLYDFGSRPLDPVLQSGPLGNAPAALADGHDGYFYSTSPIGGAFGRGAVYQISPTDGKPPTVLYSFTGLYDKSTKHTDGSGPMGGLTRGSDGAFYGTTYSGGDYGMGTVFRITSARDYKVLWSFRNGIIQPPHAGAPTPQELLDAAGAYPTTAPVAVGGSLYGVASYAAIPPYGAIYQISGGVYHGVHAFDAANVAADGASPTSLSVGANGVLWGVTARSGVSYGTVYRFQGGALTTVHRFTVAEQGSVGVIEGPDGMLYGNANPPNTYGMVFELNPYSGELTPIHSFNGTDGSRPLAELTLSKDGRLYGVAAGGGPYGRGVVFSLNLNGDHFAAIFAMDMNDGRIPVSPLIETTKDDFYGITHEGGTMDSGVFYHVAARWYPQPAHDSIFLGGVPEKADPIVAVHSAVTATQGSEVKLTDGLRVTLACARDPHVVQFVARMQDGVAAGTPYQTSWGTGKFTGDMANPIWHTDAVGAPNAYYDQAPGASHVVRSNYVDILDEPMPIPAATNAGWQVTAKDFCICNCQVVRVVNWTRSGKYDPKLGLSPPKYSGVSIEQPPVAPVDSAKWSTAQLKWVNDHLATDKYDPIQPD
jgi:uncharacterized repeat protein (TIGR03803 family)